MRYLYHKLPLVIKAKKQNEYHDRFNEKVFYRGTNPHTSATSRLLHLSKKIKFLFVLFFAALVVFGIGYVNSMQNKDNAKSKISEFKPNDNDSDSTKDKDKKSDYEIIHDITVTPESND